MPKLLLFLCLRPAVILVLCTQILWNHLISWAQNFRVWKRWVHTLVDTWICGFQILRSITIVYKYFVGIFNLCVALPTKKNEIRCPNNKNNFTVTNIIMQCTSFSVDKVKWNTQLPQRFVTTWSPQYRISSLHNDTSEQSISPIVNQRKSKHSQKPPITFTQVWDANIVF